MKNKHYRVIKYLKMSTIFLSSVLYFCVYIFPQVQCGPFVANIVKKNGVVTLKSNSNSASQFKSKTYNGSDKDDVSQSDVDENLEPVPDDISIADLNNDPEISIAATEETDSPTIRKVSSSFAKYRVPWSYTKGMTYDMTSVKVYTFNLNRNQARIDFIGSRELNYTVVIVCTKVILHDHGDYFEITDGLGGQLLYTKSRKFAGSRRASNEGTDLYVRYEGRNPSTKCTVRRVKQALKGIRQLPVAPSEVPPVNQKCQCLGKLPRTFDTKIVGGHDATPFEFPWQVAVVVKGTRASKCGASLINERYAVTAAHCFYGRADDLEILLHAHELDQFEGEFPVMVPGNDTMKIKTDADEQSLRLKIENVIVHPLFDPELFDYDVALIRFRDQIDFSQYPEIKPICLESWKSRTDYSGQSALVSGWGVQEDGSREVSRWLRKVTLKMYSRKSCQEFNKESTANVITPRFICGGYLKGGKDSCQGDSGGPLSIHRNNKWLQIGVVSGGDGCARKHLLGLYSSIGETRQWIQRTVERDTKWCQE